MRYDARVTSSPPGSLYVIGDIHGCADELKTLLNKLPLSPSSTVVFLGDYIDRGPQARQVVDTILTLRDFCHVVTLSGNHESMLSEFLRDSTSHEAGMFIYNGGGATLASYADQHGRYAIPESHLQFYATLSLFYQTPDFFFVHAGVPNLPLDELDAITHRKEMLWVRRTFLDSDFPWNKTIVHGHSPVREVHFAERRINIDTGCVFRRTLTALELPSRQIYSVPRNEQPRQVHLRDYSSNRIAIRYRGAIPIYVFRGLHTLEFETIDYNEFGMLMRVINKVVGAPISVGDEIEGHIGSQGPSLVAFRGTVLRIQDSDVGPSYAIKFVSLGESTEG